MHQHFETSAFAPSRPSDGDADASSGAPAAGATEHGQEAAQTASPSDDAWSSLSYPTLSALLTTNAHRDASSPTRLLAQPGSTTRGPEVAEAFADRYGAISVAEGDCPARDAAPCQEVSLHGVGVTAEVIADGALLAACPFASDRGAGTSLFEM